MSIWMYCCSGCLRPPCGGTLATVPSSIFKQRLLHAFARNVARDRDVLARLADLVDLVDVEHAALGRFEIEIGRVQQLEQQVLDILADIARLGQRRGIADRERHIEDLRQRPGQQGLAAAGRTEQQDVRFIDFDIRAFGRRASDACSGCERRPPAPSWRDPARSRIRRDGRRFRAARESLLKSCLLRAAAAALLLQNRLAQLDALAADVDVAGAFDQRPDVAIALAAERTESVLLGRAAAATAAINVPS